MGYITSLKINWGKEKKRKLIKFKVLQRASKFIDLCNDIDLKCKLLKMEMKNEVEIKRNIRVL